MDNIATFIKRIGGWRGEVHLYRVNPPVEWTDYDDQDELVTNSTDHVLVSAVSHSGFIGSAPETYIFPADAEGNALNMKELHGSFKGGLSHREALARAGYQVENAIWIASSEH